MGRTKIIETPTIMAKYFEDYEKWVNDNPILVKDWVGGGGKPVIREKQRPLTTEGFTNWLEKKGIIGKSLGKYFTNTDGAYEEFRGICAYIKRVIRQNQIEGGMSGIYNASITQRLNNLVEKQAVENTVKVVDITLNLD